MTPPFPSGFLNVLKPPGMSSHTVVARLRRVFGKGKIGHLGTLDPNAAGVLPVALGTATRTIDYLPPARKGYLAELTFGLESETLDTFGRHLVRHPVPDITREALEEVCAGFSGTVMQVPPSVSALHVDGFRSYELVRQGLEVELPPRPAVYYGVTVQELWRDQGNLKAFLEVECGPGTYVRALIRDIGAHFGCGACMSFLLRTQSGLFTLDQAVALEEISPETLPRYLMPPGEVLHRYGLPILAVTPVGKPYERNQQLPLTAAGEWSEHQAVILRDEPSGELIGLGRLNLQLGRVTIERLF